MRSYITSCRLLRVILYNIINDVKSGVYRFMHIGVLQLANILNSNMLSLHVSNSNLHVYTCVILHIAFYAASNRRSFVIFWPTSNTTWHLMVKVRFGGHTCCHRWSYMTSWNITEIIVYNTKCDVMREAMLPLMIHVITMSCSTHINTDAWFLERWVNPVVVMSKRKAQTNRTHDVGMAWGAWGGETNVA